MQKGCFHHIDRLLVRLFKFIFGLEQTYHWSEQLRNPGSRNTNQVFNRFKSYQTKTNARNRIPAFKNKKNNNKGKFGLI